MEKLGVPGICRDLILKPRGLVLLCGATGSGKSTTMASMLDYLNQNASRYVITIEDPIEYLHNNKKCIISQRDLGDDTKSFATALKYALRHDPDVIIVGEMRDLETISTAMTAAETGNLVVSTLHAADAAQAVDRIIDVFPSSQQQQVRLQFSQVLEAVLVQTLLPRLSEKGRIPAFEVMIATPAIRNLIREKRTHEIANVIQLSTQEGMQTLDQSLADLLRRKLVSKEEASLKSSHPDKLQSLVQFR
jgi:twitching motility protein PilT